MQEHPKPPESTDQPYFHRDRCPSCGAGLFEAVPAVRARAPAESLPLDELGPFGSGYTSDRTFFTYYRCRTCSTLFCPVYFTQEQLDNLCAHQPENMDEAPLAARRKAQESYFRILTQYSRMAGGYLELGPDVGLFTQLCARHGGFGYFWLYEPNLDVHPALRARLAGHKFSLRSVSYPGADMPEGAVSTAVLIHVLDHVLEPRRVVADVYSCLDPGGILFTVTHNANSLLARLLGRRWPPHTLPHPQLFSPTSVERLLTGQGFDVLRIARTTNYFPATYLMRATASILGSDASWLPNLDRPLLGIRLGNIAVVARKRGHN